MLNRLSDFMRIVNPEPSDTLITQRKDAIGAFMERFSERELRYACADLAAFGFADTPSTPQVIAAQAMVDAIRGAQPSFSNEIGGNELDLRVFSGIALGEYLSQQGDGTTAALVISALATRKLPEERYLREFLLALLEIARLTATEEGDAQRARPELITPAFQATDVPSLAEKVSEALEAFKEAIELNLQADREELEILWWVFGSHSTSLGKAFQALDVPLRIFASASELAELVIVPPTRRSAQFLRATLKEGSPLTLHRLIESCPQVLLEAVARRRGNTSEVISGHPALLPLTWLCCRRLDSGMVGGWEAEFEKKTHISADDERAASNWATQIFNECIATRLLAEQPEQEEE